AEVRQRPLAADVGQVRTEEASLTADRVTLRAGVARVDGSAGRGVARARFGRALPPELLHVRHHPPDFALLQDERARHLGVGDAVADRREQLAIGAAVAEAARVQRDAASAFAIRPVAATAASAEAGAPQGDAGARR